MTNFDWAFKQVVGEEGTYSDDPEDNGNWTGGQKGKGILKGTKYGVSAKAYPNLDIKNLTLDQAKKIAREEYWDKIRGDELPKLWSLIMFDCAYNQGWPIAIRLAQDACGVTVDGVFGQRTMNAIHSGDDRRPARFMALRALRYLKDPTWSHHGYGWYTRLFVMAFEANQE